MNHPQHHLYVALAANMVGRIPLMPCFLDGNATLTIPHKYSKNENSCFLEGCADAAAENGRLGSNVYEVNTWLWQFGRGKPRLGCLTIEETQASDMQVSSSSSKGQTSVGRRLMTAARVMVLEM
jgi:hypothetical protein